MSSVCGSKSSQKFLGKSGATPARMNRKCALNVQMAGSALVCAALAALACLRNFRVSSVCGSKRSHKFLGKSGATPARMNRKCALNVQMARSATLLRCVLGGTN